jgi:hypothetical protein
MKVARGRFREARAYLWYVAALLRPGIEVPVFAEPTRFEGNLDRLDDADLKVLIEEGRRQTRPADRRRGTGQVAGWNTADDQRGRDRGPVGQRPPRRRPQRAADGGVGGQRPHGPARRRRRRRPAHRTSSVRPYRYPDRCRRSAALPTLARGYVESTGYGEQTVAARVTLLRDGVLLAVAAAILYAVIWPFTSTGGAADRHPGPSTPERSTNHMPHDLYTVKSATPGLGRCRPSVPRVRARRLPAAARPGL